jgi:hypothetical protein
LPFHGLICGEMSIFQIASRAGTGDETGRVSSSFLKIAVGEPNGIGTSKSSRL